MVLREIAKAFKDAIAGVALVTKTPERETNLPGYISRYCMSERTPNPTQNSQNRIELNEDYELEVKEEEAFVTLWPTTNYTLLEDWPEAPVESSVNVDLLVAQLAIVNPPLPVPKAPPTRPRRKRGTSTEARKRPIKTVAPLELPLSSFKPMNAIIESKDEIFLLEINWFKQTYACLHVDKTTKNEKNGIFNEFKYEDKMLNKAEGYYTSEVSDNELFDNP
ncbi:2500_t:CDS:2 [Cetraspora pellucida]|uniref:2500_t:CDS:1 n=1 Tax=Cetraspora pellucida TaxID=1433469 RepID=A0A9N9A110_9GLOM|nr:2500_t:CDS:2 [Cetraspora pellucida]